MIYPSSSYSSSPSLFLSTHHFAMYNHRARTKLFLSLLSISAFAFLLLSSVKPLKKSPKNTEIPQLHLHKHVQIARSHCEGTLYPELCVSTLSTFPDLGSKTVPEIISAALSHIVGEVRLSASNCSGIRKKLKNLNTLEGRALTDCLELYDCTTDQLQSAISDLSPKKSPAKHYHDLQTLLSGSMTNLYTCLDGFAYSKKNIRSSFQGTVQNISHHVSNSLAMLKKIPGVNSSKSEIFPEYGRMKDGFPAWLSGKDRRLLQSSTSQIRYNLTVAKDGSGDFTTIGEAIAAAPSSSTARFVIYIKAGVYFEYLDIARSKSMLMLVGDGIENTYIKGNRSVGGGWTTFRSSTVAIFSSKSPNWRSLWRLHGDFTHSNNMRRRSTKTPTPNERLVKGLSTRTSTARFIKLCNQLSDEKKTSINDIGFGGLLQICCSSLHHNLCLYLIDHFNFGFCRLDITPNLQLPLTTTDVGQMFGISTIGRRLVVNTTPSDVPFGSITSLEDKLQSMPLCEEFRRSFIFYACATVLSPTSRLHGCRDLWHTIHDDDFRNDVNWAKFVLDGLVDGIRGFHLQQTTWVKGCLFYLQLFYVSKCNIPSFEAPISIPQCAAWTDDLIKKRITLELRDFGEFGHAEVIVDIPCDEDDADEATSEDLLMQFNVVEHKIEVHQAAIREQVQMMKRLVKKFQKRRNPNISEEHAAPSEPDLPDETPSREHFAMMSRLSPNINMDDDIQVHEVAPSVAVSMQPPAEGTRYRRLRRVAAPLLSPFMAEPMARQSVVKPKLKDAADIVFDNNRDTTEELYAANDFHLTRGDLISFRENEWISNHVMTVFTRQLNELSNGNDKVFLSSYITEVFFASEPKKSSSSHIISRLLLYLEEYKSRTVACKQVFIPVLLKDHWTLLVLNLIEKRIELLDSMSGRVKKVIPAQYQKLASVMLGLVSANRLETDTNVANYTFVKPDVPHQDNSNDCGVFVMLFMETWCGGGFNRTLNVAKMKQVRMKLMGKLILAKSNEHLHKFITRA